jgi:putative hydrolase of the HAD superfamily
MQAINSRISLYMVQRMGMAPADVDRLRKEYFERYGTTMRGLAVHYNIDCADFLAFVHDLPVSNYLKPDAELAAALERLPWNKSIFTNASEAHARRVLTALGVEGHFSRIFDVAWLDFVGKPAEQAYLRVAEALSAGPDSCVMVDDSRANLAEAGRLGMITVLVAEAAGGATADADFRVHRAAQVAEVAPLVSQLARQRRSGLSDAAESGRP